MARLPRLYAPRIPQLVHVQFAHPLAQPHDPSPAEHLNLLWQWLQDSAREHRIAVHGWVLLKDRAVLLATPPGPEAMPRFVQTFGRRFASRLRHGRVFSGRYRSALVEPGRWVLPALVWLESLPVSLKEVDQAQLWPWSSVRGHIGVDVQSNDWLIDHADYWQGGNTPFDRQARYRALLDGGLGQAQVERIEKAVFGQWALGDSGFLAQIGSSVSRRPAPGARGRPRKNTAQKPGD